MPFLRNARHADSVGVPASVEDRLTRISRLSDMDDQWADEDDFLPMYTIGFYYRGAMWLNAVNAMLTWIKIFKFLK